MQQVNGETEVEEKIKMTKYQCKNCGESCYAVYKKLCVKCCTNLQVNIFNHAVAPYDAIKEYKHRG